MKMNKILILTMAAALVVGGLTITHAYAQGASENQGAFRGRFLHRIKEKLNLTPDQVTQIKTVLKADKENLTAIASKMHAARLGLRQAIRAPGATEANVRAASAQVATVEADMAVERMKLFAQISPILTQAQKDKLAEMEQHLDEFVDSAIARAGQELAD
jgi:Spy/CpxP family protein refolding chaperone